MDATDRGVRRVVRIRKRSRCANWNRRVNDCVLRRKLLHIEIDGLDERLRIRNTDVHPLVLTLWREPLLGQVVYHNLVALLENFLKSPANLTVAINQVCHKSCKAPALLKGCP